MALKIKLSPKHIAFLKLLQESSRDNHGKFCLSCYDKDWNHPSQLFNSNPYKLFKYADMTHNIYFSENQFSRNQRSVSSLEDLDDIFCDCDCIKSGIQLQNFLSHLPRILAIAHLPQPCIKFSGHGFHLIYVISQIICRPNTKRGSNLIQYWRNTEEFTINKINQACLKIFHKSPVDLSVHDTSRVLRLADTNNVKRNPTKSYWVSIAKHIYTLKDFWDGKTQFPKTYRYYRHNFNNTYKQWKQSNQLKKDYKHTYIVNHKKKRPTKMSLRKERLLGNSRMNWLINAFYKQKHQHLQGIRDLYLFILAREASKVYKKDTDKTVNLIKFINSQIKPRPLEKKGLDKIIKEVEDKYDNAKIEKYNYTTLLICKLLHIHPTYSHTRQMHRQNITQMHYNQKMQKDEKTYNQIIKCRNRNQSFSSIARQFHRSRHYISNVIKRHKKYQATNIKNMQLQRRGQDKHLSRFCQRGNTVESPQDNSKIADSILQTTHFVYNPNYNSRQCRHCIPKLKMSDNNDYEEYRHDSLIAIIKNHKRTEVGYNNKYDCSKRHKREYNQYTDKQKKIYNAINGYQEYGQSKLVKNRKIFKLIQWLKTGIYKKYGLNKQQIYKFIQQFSK